MNSDQVKGATKETAGKIQEKTGELIGSKEQQAKGLVKRYGQVTALDGADFELRAGEILAVINTVTRWLSAPARA